MATDLEKDANNYDELKRVKGLQRGVGQIKEILTLVTNVGDGDKEFSKFMFDTLSSSAKQKFNTGVEKVNQACSLF